MKTASPAVWLRVLPGESRPHLLVWNEGLLRSPAAASAMAFEASPRRLFSSGLLMLFVARAEERFPQLSLNLQREAGWVRVEGATSDRVSLAQAGELALGMGLSMHEPGRCAHVRVLRPTPRLCRAVVHMLRDNQTDLVEMQNDDVYLNVSCTDDGSLWVIAQAKDILLEHTLTSFGFLPTVSGDYLSMLDGGAELSARLLLRLLEELQREGTGLAITLNAPQLRRVH